METSTATIPPTTITAEGIRHLCAEIDLLQDEVAMLKRQLADQKDKYQSAMKKLRYLINELEAER